MPIVPVPVIVPPVIGEDVPTDVTVPCWLAQVAVIVLPLCENWDIPYAQEELVAFLEILPLFISTEET